MATDHLAIGDVHFDRLREHFTEPELVQLGMVCGICAGIGRMSATWDLAR